MVQNLMVWCNLINKFHIFRALLVGCAYGIKIGIGFLDCLNSCYLLKFPKCSFCEKVGHTSDDCCSKKKISSSIVLLWSGLVRSGLVHVSLSNKSGPVLDQSGSDCVNRWLKYPNLVK